MVYDDAFGNADEEAKKYFLRHSIPGLEHIGGVEFGFRLLMFHDQNGVVIADFQGTIPFINDLG
jgi:hypothetical protein